MLATLCFTGAANSQSPDQPRREADRPRENPEGRPAESRRPEPPRLEIRREEGRRPEEPRPDARREESRRPEPPKPEGRREEGRSPQPGALAPWNRRPEMREGGPRDGDRSRAPEGRRPSIGDRPEASRRSPGSGPMPQGPRSGPPGLEELRHQVMVLTRQVQELRDGMQRLVHRSTSGDRPPQMRGGPGPESRDARPPMPPRRDSDRSEHRMHPDGGSREKSQPHPPGDRPSPRGDREPQGNPPPPPR